VLVTVGGGGNLVLASCGGVITLVFLVRVVEV
jgi:hypothetical protein